MIPGKYSIFDSMMEGVQVLDRDFRYLYVNDAVLKQAKTTRSELLGHTLPQKFPGVESTELYQQISQCFQKHKSCKALNEFEFPDGSIGWFDLCIEPVEDGILIMSFDVTHLKQMEMDLRRANEDLENKVTERTKELQQALDKQKELNELKSRFVSMASHEFRTPLTGVLLSANLLEKYSSIGEYGKLNKHISRIKATVRDLERTVGDFLSVEKLEQGKIDVNYETFELQDYLESIIEELEDNKKDSQAINYRHIGSSLIFLDKQLLHHVITNLLSNALKYSDKDVSILSEITEDSMVITVSDNGIGIPKSEQKHLFDKFFRAGNTGGIQGTGLGLAIVKRYLELVEGSIAFKSIQNKGTTFTVIVPAAKLAMSDTNDYQRSTEQSN